jgi:L-rhamnose mutarotase
VEKYKECHARVWPEVLKQIKDSNIEDCKSFFFWQNPCVVWFCCGGWWEIGLQLHTGSFGAGVVKLDFPL